MSFTKLASTVPTDSRSILVGNVIERNFDGTKSGTSDGAVNWEVGDQIVIASSSVNYADEEVRTLIAVEDLGSLTRLTFEDPLDHRHFGEVEQYGNGTRDWDIDMRAEVALLNRSITIRGTVDTDVNFGDRARFEANENTGISAHAMIMPGAGQITIDGVRFDKMGQTAQIGRYPIHWHLAGDRSGDILRHQRSVI
ncbi:MAG: hypothetical protein P8L85_08345 [Rubripirellula sp.]|nr:hypothetical protein [Rubripirellula sp.]